LKEIESHPHVQPVIFTEFTNAQALIAPFPSLDYTLMDGAGDDQLLTTLEDHLRRRIDERHRLVMVILIDIHGQNLSTAISLTFS
jgi:hypothetical protein